jgi:multiple sugar transport system substrate-binding protein
MKLKKEKLIEKYNIAFGFFIVAILGILGYNFLVLDIFKLNTEKEITKVYFADNISIAHQIVIDMFNEKYKGEIEVIPIDLPFTKFTTNERKELLARSLRSDNSIFDIFAVDQVWVSRFAKWAEPLDNYFSSQEINKILPGIIPVCSYQNKVMSIPLYLDIGMLFYRKDMIKRLPNSDEIIQKLQKSIEWNEFIQICQKNFAKNNSYIFQAKDYEGLICNYLEVLSGLNGELSFTNQTKISDQANLEAIQFFYDLIHTYKISPMAVTNFSEVLSYRYSYPNNVPFMRAWFSSINDTVAFDLNSDEMNNFEMVPLPHFGDNKFYTVFGGWNLMIKKDSEKKEAASKFLKFVLSDEAQEIMYLKADYLFVTKNMYDREDLLKDLNGMDIKDIIENHTVHRPVAENYTKLSDIYSYYLNQAISGEIGSEIAMEKIVNTIFSDKIFIK